jgi:hypothetical protein
LIKDLKRSIELRRNPVEDTSRPDPSVSHHERPTHTNALTFLREKRNGSKIKLNGRDVIDDRHIYCFPSYSG